MMSVIRFGHHDVAGGFLFVATDCGGVKAEGVFAVSGAHPTQKLGELECLVSR